MGHKKIERIDPLTVAFADGGVDSHAHLDGEEFDQDREDVLWRAKKAGLSFVLNVFLNPRIFSARKELFSNHPEVYYILGMHPCDVTDFIEDDTAFQMLEEAFAKEERLRALGEIGLDYYWSTETKELQWELFEKELALAKKLQKPVVIHCRDAEADCLAMLESHGFRDYPLLWHCFGGDKTLVMRLLGNGWYISVPGPVTYPANSHVREAVALIPKDRLLFETDAPYLSPLPWRGRRNEPAYTVFTVRALADARGEDAEELWKQCGENARRFFSLP